MSCRRDGPTLTEMAEEQEQADAVGRVVSAALRAVITGEDDVLEQVFTEDVSGQSPNMYVLDRDELAHQLADRRGALTDVVITVDEISGPGPELVVRWSFAGTHSGTALFNEDEFFEPTGRRLHLDVVSDLVLREGRICAFRNRYDDADLAGQALGSRPRN